jgi:hypothetical protein
VTLKSRFRAVVYGAIGGALLGLFAVVLLGGRFALESAVAVPVSEGSPRADVDFVVSSGALYWGWLLTGIVGGLAIAGLTYAVGREAEPDAPKFPLRWLLPIAGIVSGIAAYSVLRFGLALTGDITMGEVTISVLSMALLAAASGAVAGAVTALIVDQLARPSTLGLGGVAWPESTGELMGAMTKSVGLPIAAVLIAGSFAVGLAQVLIEVEGTAAVVIFSVAGAVVLGIATLLAYRPWERDGDGSTT